MLGYLRLAAALLCGVVLYVPSLYGHEVGVTDTGVEITRDGIKLIYTVPADHLEEIGRSSDGLVASESLEPIQQAVLDGFEIRNKGQVCRPVASATKTLENIGSEQFVFSLQCGGPVTQLSIQYNLLFDDDSAHENIARVSVLNNTQTVVFSTANRTHKFDIEAVVRDLAKIRSSGGGDASAKITLASSHYFLLGLEHILIGFDHLLFLCALVLLPMSLRALLLLVTVFTVAHSLTLAVAVLDILALTPAIVELLIALSIIVVAADSIFYLQRRGPKKLAGSAFQKRLFVSFFFGLLHGFGFSYVLSEIGLADSLLGSLLFFNLGVEFGQLLVLLFVLPVIIFLFTRFPQALWAQLTSLLVGSVGLFWFGERLIAIV